jgi:hypothetical protein
MVEPLHPDLRRELLNIHDGLDDNDLNRLEELTARRFTLRPDRDAAELREIDAEREALLREKLPFFREVSASFAARRNVRAPGRAEPRFTVAPNRDYDGPSASDQSGDRG